ncbi:ABC transporter permease [Candidatus Leptofilum sp.]|uniref:ABC transporter permease n=1 Tax=Candidatus Leptofilum sp. TaxID=3241576 RepID=UPI003B5CD026
MRHTLDIYRRLLSVQIRSQMQYRASFFFDALASSLIVLTEFGSVALVLQRFENIQGWTLPEVAFLYGLVELSFGLMDMLFSGFDPPHFAQKVRQGSFDQLLLRPINITAQVLGSDLQLRRLGRITFGIGIFVLAMALNDIAWTLAKIAYLPVVIASLVAFFGGLFVIGGTISFWTVESVEVMNMLTYGGSFTISYPMTIYPNWLRRFFTYIVPAIFLNFYPALYFLGRPDPFNFPAFAPFAAPLVGFGTLWLALRFWHFGIRHYQSTGN